MTYEEKVRWLRRYQDSLRREQELAQEVERLRSEAARVTPLLSGMPGGAGDGNKLPRAVEGIVQAQQELQAQINQCGAIRREVVAALEQISNPRDHEILRRRYLLGQKWEKVAEQMNYCVRQVKRIHKVLIESIYIDNGENIDYNGAT